MIAKLKKSLLCFLILSIQLSGIAGNLRFRKIKSEALFPSKSIKAIAKDSTGYMWFGSYESLIRFDGTTYTVYKLDELDPTSLASKNVYALHVDKFSNLWIGGSSGLSKYLPQCDCFQRYTNGPFAGNTVNAITSDTSGNVLVGTDAGLIVISAKTGIPEKRSIHEVISSLNLNGNLLYIGTENNGLYIYDILSWTVLKKINNSNYSNYDPQSLAVLDIVIDKDRNVWFTASNGGLYKYFVNADSVESISLYSQGNRINTTLFCLEFLNDDELLIGSQNQGLLVYSISKGTQDNYLPDESSDLSFASKSVRCIFTDQYNNVWFGTNLGGTCYINKNDLSVKYFRATNSNNNYLNYHIVSSFSEDSLGNIWVGTDGGGVNIFNPRTNKFKVANNFTKITSKSIVDIVRDSSGYQWIASWHNALIRANERTFAVESMFYDTSDINTRRSWNDFKGLFYDSSNRVWAFPLFRSPLIFEPNGQIFSEKHSGNYPPELFKLPLLIDATQDITGNIWLYGFEKLAVLSPDNTLQQFNTGNNGIGLSSTSIINVFADSKNNIWVCTENGFDKYNRELHNFENITAKHSFPSKIFAIEEDDNGFLWCTSNNGLCRFHPDSMVMKYFEKNIPIEGEEFMGRASFTASDGTMYFGSLNGFISFHPNEMKNNSSRANVILSEFSVYNKRSKYTDSLSPLTKPVDVTDTLVVEHYENVLGFTFSSLSFVAPHKNTYAYRLLGFEKEWNYVGSDKKATYTNLDPGTYTLQVKAANNESVWSNEIKKLTIIVKPPWWKTWWFRTLFILFILGVFFLISFWRMMQVKKINKILEEKVALRTEELIAANESLLLKKDRIEKQKDVILQRNIELVQHKAAIELQKEELHEKNNKLLELNTTKDKFFSIIAHDLKNPLSVLMGLAEVFSRSFAKLSDEKKIEFARTIEDSAKRLYALLENLLQWSRTQSGGLPFRPKLIKLQDLLNINISMVTHQAEDKKITIHINSNEEIMVVADENMLRTVTRNIISNAIKFTKKGGSIFIILSKNENSATIEFKDTGIGMSEETISKLFKIDSNITTPGTENETGTGLGLLLCKEFVERHNGRIWAESKIGKGTSFFVELPLSEIQ